jgi:hypothetical protein
MNLSVTILVDPNGPRNNAPDVHGVADGSWIWGQSRCFLFAVVTPSCGGPGGLGMQSVPAFTKTD